MKDNSLLSRIIKGRYFFSVMSLFVLIGISCMLSPSFLSLGNFITILRQASILLILSMGLTAVVLTGNIDLSVGSSAALCGCVCAQMLVAGFPVILCMGASLLIGLTVGFINGLLVGILKLPSFIATYGMNMVASGLAMIVMNGGVIYGLPTNFTTLGVGYLGPLPVPVILAGILVTCMTVLLQKTVFGRNIYMIGYNANAADYSGVNSLRTLLGAYLLCGMTGAIGGIVMTARLNAADFGMTEAYGLQIVAAVVVGGTSLLGGEGGVPGTVIGAIILTIIVNIMNIMGVNSNWQGMVHGIVILFVVWLDVFARRVEAGRALRKQRESVKKE